MNCIILFKRVRTSRSQRIFMVFIVIIIIIIIIVVSVWHCLHREACMGI